MQTKIRDMEYFTKDLEDYLNNYGLLSTANEYARVNAVQYGDQTLGFKNGRNSLWWAFSWSDTVEGYGFWSNHHERFLILQRQSKI